jgi:hypothetical protein
VGVIASAITTPQLSPELSQPERTRTSERESGHNLEVPVRPNFVRVPRNEPFVLFIVVEKTAMKPERCILLLPLSGGAGGEVFFHHGEDALLEATPHRVH